MMADAAGIAAGVWGWAVAVLPEASVEHATNARSAASEAARTMASPRERVAAGASMRGVCDFKRIANVGSARVNWSATEVDWYWDSVRRCLTVAF